MEDEEMRTGCFSGTAWRREGVDRSRIQYSCANRWVSIEYVPASAKNEQRVMRCSDLHAMERRGIHERTGASLARRR